jgi:hypothetical protein
MANSSNGEGAAGSQESRQIQIHTGAAPKLDALPDTLDFRDLMYVPTLVEVPQAITLDQYLEWTVPVLNQGNEGACTGFGLATVVHYLMLRRRDSNHAEVSPRMLYEMAKRFDEWPGHDYSGSSARGAMKGWHKYGVCSLQTWPFVANQPDLRLTNERVNDALNRPLGAYFRVNHTDIVAMHSALAEVGILYVTANVHSGWSAPDDGGHILESKEMLGGHAFAIVAYDDSGFWVQNSWDVTWGKGGFGHVTYDDWLTNGTDAWVARLGAPVFLQSSTGISVAHSAAAGASEAYTYAQLRPHIVSIGNDGKLRQTGTYGTTRAEVDYIFEQDFPEITKDWTTRRILLYAHGGLVPEASAVQRLADYRQVLLDHEVYPISFIWHTDFWNTLTNIIQDALSKRRPEGLLDAAKDFMLDRLDDALEPIARTLMGKAGWDEMKENGLAATVAADGATRAVAPHLVRLAGEGVEIHVAGHSAGSIFHAPLVQWLTAQGPIPSGPMTGEEGLGITIKTATLWAPAMTVALFRDTYLPAIKDATIGEFALFALTDAAERDDDCAGLYHKSLLYLVSNAFEATPHIPMVRDGVPILGLEKFVNPKAKTADPEVAPIFDGRADLILAPNTAAQGTRAASTCRHHGGFDDDKPTVLSTLARILGRDTVAADPAVTFQPSGAHLVDNRRGLAYAAAR